MDELYKSNDPMLALPTTTTTTTTTKAVATSGQQVQKSASKKKSKNKKTHTVNAIDEVTTSRKFDQCTNDDDDKNISRESIANALINGIVEQAENLHIKDNGYCLANGSKLNGHQYDGAQHVSESTTTTTATTIIAPAKQLVNEKSKKSKSKSKNKDHCQLKHVENCVENGEPLMAINTGKPTVLNTAKETTIVTDQKQQRDIIATAVAAAAITTDSEDAKPTTTDDDTLLTDPALEQPKIHIEYTEYQSELQMHVSSCKPSFLITNFNSTFAPLYVVQLTDKLHLTISILFFF